MKQPSRYAYAQARIQAAMARLPPPAFWQGLTGVVHSAGLLQKLQGSGLADWLGDLTAASSAYDIEEGLRRRLRQIILHTETWAPQPWQPAVQFLEFLPYLPLLDAHWRGRLPPPMQAADLQELLNQPGRIRKQLEQMEGLLKQASGQPLRLIWLELWQPLWKELPGNAGLASLVTAVEQHLARFRQLTPAEAWPARDHLWGTAAHIVHDHAFEPVVLFAYLLLTALAMERLRAAWLERRLFEERKEGT